MCSNPENLQTDEQKDEVSNGLASASAGGDSFNPDSIQKLLDMLRFLVNQPEGGNRRRRSTESSSVTLKTPVQVSLPRKP